MVRAVSELSFALFFLLLSNGTFLVLEVFQNQFQRQVATQCFQTDEENVFSRVPLQNIYFGKQETACGIRGVGYPQT